MTIVKNEVHNLCRQNPRRVAAEHDAIRNHKEIKDDDAMRYLTLGILFDVLDHHVYSGDKIMWRYRGENTQVAIWDVG